MDAGCSGLLEGRECLLTLNPTLQEYCIVAGGISANSGCASQEAELTTLVASRPAADQAYVCLRRFQAAAAKHSCPQLPQRRRRAYPLSALSPDLKQTPTHAYRLTSRVACRQDPRV